MKYILKYATIPLGLLIAEGNEVNYDNRHHQANKCKKREEG